MTDSMPTDGLALAELMSPELARNPQPMYGMLRDISPVLRVDGVGFVVTSRAEVDQILRDPGAFSSNMSAHDLKTERPLIPLQIDPPAHRTYRRILDPMFAPQRMRVLEEPVARLVNDLIDGFVDEGEIDFAARFSIPFPSQVFLTLFGLPLDDLPTFLGMKDGVIRPDHVVGREFGHPETEAHQQRTADSIYAYFERVLDERAGEEGDDLLSHLLHAEVDGDRLTREPYGQRRRFPTARGGHDDHGRSDPGERRRPRRRTAGRLRDAPFGQVPGARTQAARARRRHARLVLLPARDHQRRPERRGGAPEGGVRHRADPPRRDAQGLLGRRRAHQGHERGRRPRIAVLPVHAGVRRPPLRGGPGRRHRRGDGQGLQRLARPRVVRPAPGAVHPARPADDLERRADRPRGPPPRRHGLPRRHVPREPHTARRAVAPRPVLGSVLARRRGARDGHLHAHRLVVEAGHDHARRTSRRADHAPADDHRAGRGRPGVEPGAQGVPEHQDRPVRGRHRVGAVLPRPHRAHLRHAPPLDRSGPRRPDTHRAVPAQRPAVLHLRSRGSRAGRPDRFRERVLGDGLPALRLVVADRPRGLQRDATAAHLADSDVDNITHRTAMRWFDYDPFQHIAPQDATVGALRRQAGDHDISIRSMGRGRVESDGLNLGEMSKLATGR